MATAKSARQASAPVTQKAVPARQRTIARPPAKAPTGRSTKAVAPVKEAHGKNSTVKAEKKKDKPEKIKVVRDSFTIPKSEYAQITLLKKRAMALGQEVKKSELIRAGLLLLSSQSDAGLAKALNVVPTLKTGRPGKS